MQWAKSVHFSCTQRAFFLLESFLRPKLPSTNLNPLLPFHITAACKITVSVLIVTRRCSYLLQCYWNCIPSHEELNLIVPEGHVHLNAMLQMFWKLVCPRSPLADKVSIFSPDFYLWDLLNGRVYTDKHCSVGGVVSCVRRWSTVVSADTLLRVCASLEQGVQFCVWPQTPAPCVAGCTDSSSRGLRLVSTTSDRLSLRK